MQRWFKQGGVRSENFSQLFQISVYDEGGLSDKMSDHVHASKSSFWYAMFVITRKLGQGAFAFAPGCRWSRR